MADYPIPDRDAGGFAAGELVITEPPGLVTEVRKQAPQRLIAVAAVQEAIRDLIASFVVGSQDISVVHDDGNNRLVISLTGGLTWTVSANAPAGGDNGDFHLRTGATAPGIYYRSGGAWNLVMAAGGADDAAARAGVAANEQAITGNKLLIAALEKRTSDLIVTQHTEWQNVPRVELGGFYMTGINDGDPETGFGVTHVANAQGSSDFYNISLLIPTGEDPHDFRLEEADEDVTPTLWSPGPVRESIGGVLYDRYEAIRGPQILPRGTTVRLQKSTRLDQTRYIGDVSGARGLPRPTDISHLNREVDDLQRRATDLSLATVPVWALPDNASQAAVGLVVTNETSGPSFLSAVRNSVISTTANVPTAAVPSGYSAYLGVQLSDSQLPHIDDYRILWTDGSSEPVSAFPRRSDIDFSRSGTEIHYWLMAIELPEDGKASPGGTISIQHHGSETHTRFSGDVPTPTRDTAPATKAYVDAQESDSGVGGHYTERTYWIYTDAGVTEPPVLSYSFNGITFEHVTTSVGDVLAEPDATRFPGRALWVSRARGDNAGALAASPAERVQHSVDIGFAETEDDPDGTDPLVADYIAGTHHFYALWAGDRFLPRKPIGEAARFFTVYNAATHWSNGAAYGLIPFSLDEIRALHIEITYYEPNGINIVRKSHHTVYPYQFGALSASWQGYVPNPGDTIQIFDTRLQQTVDFGDIAAGTTSESELDMSLGFVSNAAHSRQVTHWVAGGRNGIYSNSIRLHFRLEY